MPDGAEAACASPCPAAQCRPPPPGGRCGGGEGQPHSLSTCSPVPRDGARTCVDALASSETGDDLGPSLPGLGGCPWLPHGNPCEPCLQPPEAARSYRGRYMSTVVNGARSHFPEEMTSHLRAGRFECPFLSLIVSFFPHTGGFNCAFLVKMMADQGPHRARKVGSDRLSSLQNCVCQQVT